MAACRHAAGYAQRMRSLRGLLGARSHMAGMPHAALTLATEASTVWLKWQERGATVWNDLQRQMKGKGFTQEELKNMYSQLRKNENH
jgi:hypothetical protein